MKKSLYAILIACSLASCQDELEMLPSPTQNFNETSAGQYAISQEQALATLEAFMMDMDSPSSRSNNQRKVSSIKPIKFQASRTLSRSAVDSIDCENLLYVANFENEQGYAILAGDSRISEPVIAVIDTGYISDKTIYTALELANEERIIYDGYPTTGPGFFTLEETGDELFMNPNTVCLYVDSIQDTLVGNFDFSELYEEDESRSAGTQTTPTVSGTTPELITGTLCATYAMNEVVDYIPWDPIKPLPEPVSPWGGQYRERTSISNWSTIKSVSPMLSLFKGWRQDKPFNDLYPNRRKWIIVGHKKKAPAGCFPLAIAKILTHFEYPSTFKYNNYTVNWDALKYNLYSAEGEQSAAHLLRGIAEGCNSWYFYQGTFTFPHNATGFMSDLSLNAHSRKYDFEQIIAMLDNGCPLIIYSVPGIRIDLSHSWNIDGYKIKERTKTTELYYGYELVSSSTTTETCEMVHCDFGWEGTSNGYYVSGVFKLGDDSVELDSGSNHSEKKTNYNNFIRIVTYDKPI